MNVLTRAQPLIRPKQVSSAAVSAAMSELIAVLLAFRVEGVREVERDPGQEERQRSQ